MTSPITPTPITALPPAPLPTDSAEVFDQRSFAFVEAQVAMVPQVNTAATQTNQNAVAAKEGADASASSASASASSATASAGSATTAADQVALAVAAKDSAEVAAAAAQAAAGLPTLSGNEGKALRVKSDGSGVEWGAAGLEVGGVYQGSKKPTVGVWLDTDAVYLQSSYPVLFAALGLVPSVAPWTQRTPATLAGIRSMAYGNGVYVALGVNGSNAAAAATSPDGVTWTSRTPPAGVESVTFGGGIFVAVGTNSVATSADGITWTARTAPNVAWKSVCYGAGLFIAVGNSNSAISSPDGVTWTTRSGLSTTLNSVGFGGGRFVAVGSANSYTSTDGISWSSSLGPTGVMNSICWGAGIFVAVGANPGNTQPIAATSKDGASWVSRSAAPVSAGASFASVSYYNGRFLAVGTIGAGNPVFQDSPDGVSWSSRYMPPGGYSAVIAENGLIIAAGTVMQTAPMFPYNTATQFYVPAPAGVVGLKSWMKAGD